MKRYEGSNVFAIRLSAKHQERLIDIFFKYGGKSIGPCSLPFAMKRAIEFLTQVAVDVQMIEDPTGFNLLEKKRQFIASHKEKLDTARQGSEIDALKERLDQVQTVLGNHNRPAVSYAADEDIDNLAAGDISAEAGLSYLFSRLPGQARQKIEDWKQVYDAGEETWEDLLAICKRLPPDNAQFLYDNCLQLLSVPDIAPFRKAYLTSHIFDDKQEKEPTCHRNWLTR